MKSFYFTLLLYAKQFGLGINKFHPIFFYNIWKYSHPLYRPQTSRHHCLLIFHANLKLKWGKGRLIRFAPVLLLLPPEAVLPFTPRHPASRKRPCLLDASRPSVRVQCQHCQGAVQPSAETHINRPNSLSQHFLTLILVWGPAELSIYYTSEL